MASSLASFQHLLAATPDPQRARRYLERLRQESPAGFDRITTSPAALRCVIGLFSYSSFLSDSVLRNPERLLQVSNSGTFYRVLGMEDYENRFMDFVGPEVVPTAVGLAQFRRRQPLRIVLRDILG